jgi:hypothetical protein
MVFLGIAFTGIALKNYLDADKSIKKGYHLPKHVYIYLITISLTTLGCSCLIKRTEPYVMP